MVERGSSSVYNLFVKLKSTAINKTQCRFVCVQSAKAKDAADTTRFPDWKLEEATRVAYTHPAITGGLDQDFLAETLKEESHGDLEGGPNASVRTPLVSELEKPVQLSGVRARAAPHNVETPLESAKRNDSQLSAEDRV